MGPQPQRPYVHAGSLSANSSISDHSGLLSTGLYGSCSGRPRVTHDTQTVAGNGPEPGGRARCERALACQGPQMSPLPGAVVGYSGAAGRSGPPHVPRQDRKACCAPPDGPLPPQITSSRVHSTTSNAPAGHAKSSLCSGVRSLFQSTCRSSVLRHVTVRKYPRFSDVGVRFGEGDAHELRLAGWSPEVRNPAYAALHIRRYGRLLVVARPFFSHT